MVAPIVAAALIGGAASLGTAAWQSSQISGANRQSRKFAREVRGWEEYMSNTAVQRHALDLEAAGFNRILAASGQGASTPGAPMAQSIPEIGNADPAAGASSAVGAVMKGQELKNLEEQGKILHETYLKQAEETEMAARANARDEHVFKEQMRHYPLWMQSAVSAMEGQVEATRNTARQGALMEQARKIGSAQEAASGIDQEIYKNMPFLRVLDAVSRSVQGAGQSALQVKRFWEK